MREQARVDPGPNRDHSIRRRVGLAQRRAASDDAWRPLGRVRATMPPMAGLALDPRAASRSVGVAGRGWRRPGAVRRRPTARCPLEPADRRRRSCSAGRSSRCRRWASSRSPSAGGCGRSGGSTRPIPANPSRVGGPWRSSAGLAALAFALLSGIDRYDTTLFSVHMVQHVLLMLVAAPLIALAAPITLLLRLSSPETRHRWILPVLHSRVVRVLAFPVVAWLDVRHDDVGGPLLAAVQRVARGPARSTTSSTRCS